MAHAPDDTMEVVVPLPSSELRPRTRDYLPNALVGQSREKRGAENRPRPAPPRRDRDDSVEIYSVSSDQSYQTATHSPPSGINAHISRLQNAVDDRTGRFKAEASVEQDLFALRPPGLANGPRSDARDTSIAESPAQLPSDLMENLIATYLGREYVNGPIFDLAEFQAACDEVGDIHNVAAGSSGFHAILMMVLSLSGLRYSRIDEGYLESLFKHAQRLTSASDWSDSPWMRVQCLFLQGQYLYATGKPKQAWALVGYALRSMQLLGLQSKAGGPSGRERQQRELGRRLWHSAVILERMLALQIGIPPQIAHPLQVPLPTHLDTDYIDSVSGGSPSAGGDRPSVIEFLLACARLYGHVEGIMAWETEARVRHDSCAAKKLLALDVAPFLKADALLYDWQVSLPSFLQADGEFEPSDDPIVRRQCDILRARSLYIRLRLYRPLLALGLALPAKCSCRPGGHPHMTGTEAGSTDSPMVYNMVRDTSIKCAAVAMELVDAIEENEDGLLDGGDDDTWRSSGTPYWENVDYLYACGTVVLAAKLLTPEFNNPRLISALRLKKCWAKVLSLLRQYRDLRPTGGPLAKAARVCQNTLESLAEALERSAAGNATAGLDEETRSRLTERTMDTPARSRGGPKNPPGSHRVYLGWIESLPVDLDGEVE
ncbi:hypothetical protein BO70DRAFT_358766 [Aspergillus heteromorphus CBS 117.55]|uniref:Xylanolytic transcriptional activator regulatory domain-containing protein n=1 Tax=Aspergillus heteromorphus CBS 117.55 TaxID=1448321 RepID=A0A317WV96_9EURO|nr:uncharacterized protein BO70DRAFT_358766 [Aspergillus heteromorphus CBS 117.55]PWY89741.1 hypothetical protein BO70DRAFT_358766 [Aspergillus heteromorphus CBS 117.55]